MLHVCEPQDKLVIRFEGWMDTAKCEEIDGQIRSAVAEPRSPVVFDLDDVDFVSSAFLRLCVYARQKAGDHGFQVVNVEPSIKRVFKIAGLDHMLQGDGC